MRLRLRDRLLLVLAGVGYFLLGVVGMAAVMLLARLVEEITK